MASSPIIVPDGTKGYSMDQLSVPMHHRDFLSSVMIPRGLIKDRIEKLAQEIHEDYQGRSIHIICILKGGEKIFSDLTNSLHNLNSRYGQKSIPITHDFIKASSYVNTKTTGNVDISADSEQLKIFNGKDILLVEDIIDTGKTIAALKDIILKQDPRSLKVVSLLIKRVDSNKGFIPDYCGFSIPDEFVVGYCLDFNEHFRDLQHICVLNPKGIERYRK
jgi:hypoxanthine phosphoribosyltransferase